MQGKLFVIEGVDGSGKQTQATKLHDRLVEEGNKVKLISFPNYGSESSSLVKMYLRGEFGKNAADVDAYIASTFYAADRYATWKTELEEFYNDGGILIADRYTQSNAIHQAGKLKNKIQIHNYVSWLYGFEYNLFKLPRPNEIFFLDIHPIISASLMQSRLNKIDNSDQKDIHESDPQHLMDAYNAALYLVNEYKWNKIDCVADGVLRSIEDINNEIYNHVKASE